MWAHGRFRAALAGTIVIACGGDPPHAAASTEATESTGVASSSSASESNSESSSDTTSTSGEGSSSTSTTDAASSSSGIPDDPASEGGSGSGGSDLGPNFAEVAAIVGIDHDPGELAEPPDCLIDAIDPPLPGFFCGPERYSGGAAAVDYDDDGDIDLYVTRSNAPDLLYQNQGDGTYVDVAPDVGLAVAVHSSGAAWGDVDNDGDADVYVSALGDTRNYLFINDDGTFVEDAVARGAAVETEFQHSSSTPAFADYDLDGDLDLYVGEWRTSAVGPHPSHARLLRNEGTGSFVDVTQEAGVDVDSVWVDFSEAEGTFVLSVGWADIDGDGYPELLQANDFSTSRLFWNDGDGTFTDGTVDAGVGTDENGMGAAVADYDRDGDLDWFVTSIYGEGETGNRLYRYEGARVFADATDDAGVREGGWGWGAAFLDHDNDADADLVMTNGWYASLYLEDAVLAWTNDGTGRMTEEAAALGIVETGQGRALLSFDADDDGDLEIVVVNNADSLRYFRNSTPDAGHWLRVRAPGTSSNRDGIGAKVTVRTDFVQMSEIGGSSHYLGHGPREAHFGLGDAELADVTVRWPASGHEVVLENVAVDQVLEIVEP